MTGVYVDFTLDGVGMQLRHCAIEDRGPRDGCFIQAASRGAVVLVNGEALEDELEDDGIDEEISPAVKQEKGNFTGGET